METLTQRGTGMVSQLAYISVCADLEFLIGAYSRVAGGFVEKSALFHGL